MAGSPYLIKGVPFEAANPHLTFRITGSNPLGVVDEFGNALTVTGSVSVTSNNLHDNKTSLLIGTASGISAPGSVLDVGTGDITIEFWHRFNGARASVYVNDNFFILDQTNLVSRLRYGNFIGILDGFMVMWGSSTESRGPVIKSIIYNQQWHHYAVVRHNNVITSYFDGVGRQSVSANRNMTGITAPFQICTNNSTIGQLQNFCIHKNFAKYTANFTPTPF